MVGKTENYGKNNNRSGDDDNNKEQEVNGNGFDDTFSDTDNDNKIHLESRSVTTNDIKEILTTLKLKYDAGQITKVDKKKVKKLLKGGKFNEAIEYMGNAITQKLQDDEDRARQLRHEDDLHLIDITELMRVEVIACASAAVLIF